MAGHVIHTHTLVQAPPELVWEVVTDVGDNERIMRSVSDSHLLTDGPYDVGTTWQEKRTMFGHHGREEQRVLAADPPLRTQFETRLGHDRILTSFSLTPMPGQDATRLSQTVTVDMGARSLPGHWAWKFFGGFSYEATRRMLEHDLEDIGAEVESRMAEAHG